MTIGNSNLIPDDPAQRAVCLERLESLLRKHESLEFACLGTVDGRPWAFLRRGEGANAQRLSAVTSSSLALCETFAREALRSRCRYSVIAAERGTIVTVRVPCRSSRFALAIGADSGETVAIALRLALDTAEHLGRTLDATPLPQAEADPTR